MKECFLVLGMHRSGTSVLTGLVSMFGGFVGTDLMKPTKDNPKGYFENNKIYLLNEKILRENNSNWHDFSFLAEDILENQFEQYVSEAKKIIEDELKYVKKILIKDPRVCVLFPIWEAALVQLGIKIKIIFSYRSPLEVAHSLHKRDEMAIEKGLMLWSHYFLQSEHFSRKYERIIVEYDSDFRDLSVLMNRIADFIDGDVTQDILQKSSDFYSPSLKHHQVTLDNISDDLPSYLNDLITILASKDFSKSKKLDSIRAEFSHSKRYYLYNQESLYKSIEEKEEIIRQKEGEFTQLETAYDELKRKHDTEHEVLVNTREELEQEKKKSFDIKNEFNKRDKDRNHQMAVSSRAVTDKQNQLDLFKTYFTAGEKLLNNLIRRKALYKKLHHQTASSSKIKLKKSLLPFAKLKNKRLMKERIAIIDSGLFSPFFYLSVNADVKQAGVDPLKHFCTKGWMEGRSPSMEFDVKAYLKNHPDVARARINPLVHYINHGKKEGREIYPVMFYGTEFTSIKSDINSKKLQKNNNEDSKQLVGPVFGDRWKETVSSIALLKKRKNIVNKNIPAEVIELSKKQLEILPLKVSVVMPTWNRVNSISKAIDSILFQSYRPAEIIISDDGSTDGTIDFLNQNYAKEISEGLIKVISNKHAGVSAARNSGLNHASGDLIAYLDSDNIWREDYLLIMAAAFSENDELACAYSALERHDKNNNNKKNILSVEYDRKRLLDANFIDLNVFIHRKIVFDQLGGFDTTLKRLVDWELIIRYTKNYIPALIPFVGVDYFLDDKNLKNITTRVSLDDNREGVYQKHFQERVRFGIEDLKLAYVLWDFPALSQTFVMEEIKWLVHQGYDVIVYYAIEPDKSATLDFDIKSYMVKDADELASLLDDHQRNFCHAHFAYPTVTKLVYPACLKAGIPFTFMPHAVDIFHHENKKRNNIGEITQHPLCKKVFVHGEFHKKFIEDCGVPSQKIAFNIQAVNVAEFKKDLFPSSEKADEKTVYRGVVITRFVEKKGLNTLIEAASLLKEQAVVFDIYGYGPLEQDYKKQIKELQLDNVFLKGPLTNQHAVAKTYAKSDFLVAPCVVAKNGDIDGFPTVILEAMAMDLPVITTDVAAIPDYLTDSVEAFVVPAADVEQLAKSIRRLIQMSPQRKAAMIKRAHSFLEKKIGVNQTMQMLLDTWQGYTLDVFLVTYNADKYDDRIETFEIVDRIFKYTTTPFTLTIIDNDSDEDFWDELCARVIDKPNVRLIRKKQNIFCGPASNTALELSDSEYAIYICSKEGFIKKHGWERSLIEHMRNHPNDIIAGHHSQMPRYIYGEEYENYPDFSKFRNPDFAKKNPERVFKHVQGGVFIIRRDFIKDHGGFNPETPHGGMDVEMSYYIESLGYGLGEIPEVASLTVKTRPTLKALVSERTVVAHPLSMDTVTTELDSLVKDKGHRCNICNWKGTSFKIDVANDEQIQVCPECSSTGFGRSVMRFLAGSTHIYRNEICALLSKDASLLGVLENLFKSVNTSKENDQFLKMLGSAKTHFDCIVVDTSMIHEPQVDLVWKSMLKKLSSHGEIIFTDPSFQDEHFLQDASKSMNIHFEDVFVDANEKYSIEYHDFSSFCIAYDWRRIGRVFPAIFAVKSHGLE